jgi:hypothetical protein
MNDLNIIKYDKNIIKGRKIISIINSKSNIISQINKNNTNYTNSITNNNNIILNKHSEYIDKRINDIKRINKYGLAEIINTSHEDYIKLYSLCLYTNLIKDIFTNSYLKKFSCSDCAGKSTDICHCIGEEKPVIIIL